jgi:hypothetical protein
VLAEEQIVVRGASLFADFLLVGETPRFFSLSLSLSVLSFPLVVCCLLKIERAREKCEFRSILIRRVSHSFLTLETDGMARIGRATISRVGALRDSSTGAAHYALPKTAELRTGAVARREQIMIVTTPTQIHIKKRGD